MNLFLGFLSYLRKLALCLWIGQMIFFVVIFAPRVFKVLPRPLAADLQAAIFPPYYLAGVICGAVILLSFLATQGFGVRSINSESGGSGELFTSPAAGTRQLTERRFKTVVGLTLFATVIFAFSLWWVTPHLTSLQPLLYGEVLDPDAQEKFQFLHKISVQLNGSVLLALLILLFLV
jgi:hypothetical protein